MTVLNPPKNFVLWCLSLVLAITCLRIYGLSLEQLNLFFDEAQYWGWSKNLDWGFYSKPPMIAWLIKATTSVCGDGEFCVRLSSPLVHTGTAGVIYLLAKELYDHRTAFYSALIYITLPAVALSSMLISTDVPLLFFWSLSLLFFIKATRNGKWRYWIFAGICAGFGMLSKYNMLIFLLSAILYLVMSKERVIILKSIKFWFSAIIAFLIFLPNIIWNFSNNFASFLHTKDNASIEGVVFHFGKMFEFIGAQFGVFGPVYFAVLLVLLFKSKTLFKEKPAAMMLSFIIPMFIVILLVSLLSRAHANWAAPIYVPATILVTGWLIRSNKDQWIKAALLINLMITVVAINPGHTLDALGFKLSGKKTDLAQMQIKDPLKRIKGWQELGKEVGEVWAQHPGTELLTYTRKTHAELLYYVTPYPANMVKWNAKGRLTDHYDLTTNIHKAATKDFLLITEYDNRDGIVARFESAEKLKEISIHLYEDYDMVYHVYYLKGFKGYDDAEL